MLWADAICINQSSTRERSHQVGKMILVYRLARRVLVWLGPNTNGQATIAFDAILDLDQKTLSAKPGHQLSPEIEQKQSNQWRSLKWLLSRPWFSRIWVVQEVISNPDVLVHCGALQIRWELLAAAVDHICAFDHDELFHVHGFLQSEIWSARIMIILQSWRRTDNDGKLGLLHFLRRFRASDARDKVFGVMGMEAFQETSETPAGPVENSWIQVDYDKSTADVYRMVAEKIIFSEPSNLTALCYVLPGSEISSQFSSWAPRWDQPDSSHILLRYIQSWNPVTNCSRGIMPSIRIVREANILEASGIQFDTIEKTTEIESELWFAPQKNRLKSSPFLELWKATNSQHFKYPTNEDITTVFSMVFTGGKDDAAGVTLEDHKMRFEKWLEGLQAAYAHPEGSISHKLGSSVNQVEENSVLWAKQGQDSSWGRAFLETKSGYMGLGPRSAEKGDVVCVLGGGIVPFLLRRVGEDTFRLVGESYIYGIMNGEVVRASTEADVKTFRIE
jgi:heterokaryon incompatibility protein (HET)